MKKNVTSILASGSSGVVLNVSFGAQQYKKKKFNGVSNDEKKSEK